MKKAWLVSGLHDCCVGKSFHKKIHHSCNFFIFVCILLKPTYLSVFFLISFNAMIMENQIFCSRYAGSIWKIRQTCLYDFILVSR